jgi:hypothetical protein
MNDVVFTILEAIIILVIMLTMRYLLPFLRVKLQSIMDEELWKAVCKEVKSVEQTIKGSKLGAVRKDEVIARVTAWANSKGISITQKQLGNLIETAVWVMKNEKKEG